MTSIVAPTKCPSCSSKLERVNDQLFCRNTSSCPAQSSGKIINFCKKLKIKGFGPSTIEKLELQDINDLLTYSPKYGMAMGLSEHMATKLHSTIQDRLKQGIHYQEFLSAVSIPLLGDSASSKLTLNSLEDISYEVCKECGLGDKVSSNLVEWHTLDWPNMIEWDKYLVFSNNNKIQTNGTTVVITGKLNDFKNRTEAKKYLEGLGFSVKSSVSKNTDYLICEDGTQGSSYKKAIQLNIPITTIKSLEDN